MTAQEVLETLKKHAAIYASDEEFVRSVEWVT